MLYEKKMLILSGDGKGVVLIEKGGHGVTFSLRTFDMTGQGPYKAGIITRTSVHVRDLPQGNDPAAQFTVDVGDVSELHFAVFDSRLRLYGTNGKRMWEANIMQLLHKHDRSDPILLVPSAPPLAELPPLVEKPRALPMTDGTGIVRTRLSVYGDEAVSDADFYTNLDLSSRMLRVDSFLDEPRVLDELAPRLVPKSDVAAHIERDRSSVEHAEIAEEVEVEECDGERVRLENMKQAESDGEIKEAAADISDARAEKIEHAELDAAIEEVTSDVSDEQNEYIGNDAKSADVKADKASMSKETDTLSETTATERERNSPTKRAAANVEKDHVETLSEAASAERERNSPTRRAAADVEKDLVDTLSEAASAERERNSPTRRAAADVEKDHVETLSEATSAAEGVLYESDREMPWEVTAKWLKNRTDRQLFIKRDIVKKPKTNERVRFLRESSFFERARADIDKLFANGKKDEKLSALLPDIEWVRVEFGGHYISVGRGDDAFLCYAVAGRYEKSSPIGDEAQWLPSDGAQPTGKGYWLIFQNLEDGEIIKN